MGLPQRHKGHGVNKGNEYGGWLLVDSGWLMVNGVW